VAALAFALAPTAQAQTVSAPHAQSWRIKLEHLFDWLGNSGSSLAIKAPAVESFTGPTSLSAGEVGEWRVRVSHAADKNVTYEINWGDSSTSSPDVIPVATSTVATVTTATSTLASLAGPKFFHHVYEYADTYTVTLAARSSAGISTQVSTTLTVGPFPSDYESAN
jgi:hypothetical protein